MLRIIEDAHNQTGHGGCSNALQYLRQKYHMVSMRKKVKRYNRRCIKCAKANARTGQQLMGLLPEARVTPGRCFQDTGLDCFGPFAMKARPGRCKLIFKEYGIIFRCMRSLAAAVELAEDMTTDSTLNAFTRVSYTRGRIERAWSDNGLNFVGAANELEEIRKIWEAIPNSNNWKERGTEWRFIAPGAPHTGGVWESGIKLIKTHIYKIIGDRVLTPEEMRTLFAEVSGYLNSRPLTVLYDDEVGISTITPGHFLVGSQIVAPPTCDVPFKDKNHMQRWQMVQEKAGSLWKQWSQEVVTQMFGRLKWKKPVENVKIGDIVLVKNENLARTVANCTSRENDAWKRWIGQNR